MSGRLFTPAVVVGCVLLARQMATQTLTTKLIVLGVVIALGLASPNPTLRTGSAPALTVLDRNGITDERAHYFPQTGLLSMARNAPRPSHDWALQGMQWAERGAIVLAQQAIGMHGYFAGPDVHIVDELGLADALLSRLPTSDTLDWRIGHFRRALPDGNLESIRTDTNHIQDPDLARFYDRMRLITRGALFDPLRLQAIWELNTGQYSPWLGAHLARSTGDAAPATAE